MRIFALVCIISTSFYLLTTSINITWTTLPITMPFYRYGIITAFDIHTGLVWILGGNTNAIYQWNMTSNNFAYVGALSHRPYSYAQNWVTKGSVIYWIYSESIHSFNMSSAMEIANDLNASFPYRTDHRSCVTTDGDSYLVIVGGVDPYSDYTQIFNFETNTWRSSVANLKEGRRYPTCHVYNGSVYAIAGRGNESATLKTVETLVLETMSNWTRSPHQLTTARYFHRSALINDFIIVTGGWDGRSRLKLKSVEIISMVDGSITCGADLNIAVSKHGIIRDPMNNVVVIGGLTSSGETNKIQISNVLTDPNVSNQSPVILVICLVLVSCLIIVFYKMRRRKKTKRNDCADDDDPQKVNNIKPIKQIDLNIATKTTKNSTFKEVHKSETNLYCEGIPAPSAPVECSISDDDKNRGNVPFLETKAFGERIIEMQPGAKTSSDTEHVLLPVYDPAAENNKYYTMNEGMHQVREWLISLDLSEYFDIFVENGFDKMERIKLIDSSDLTEMGITKIGHRKQILSAVKIY